MPPKPWLTLSDGSILTRQEQFVLRQVAAGEVADLKQEFSEVQADRGLRARFLEELLTGQLKGVEVHLQGINIKNAVVEEPINLQGGEIGFYVDLDNCIFKESVRLRDARFKNTLSLVRSHFLQRADFDRIKVAVNLFCMNATFTGPANFGGADIGREFSTRGAKFLCENHRANFNHLKGGQSVHLNGAEFHGPVDFEAAEIRGQFVMSGAKFLSEIDMASFINMQIGQNVHLNEAEFRGPADFGGIEIRGQFVAYGTRFLSDYKTNFYRMRVGQDAIFQGCGFHGVVSFVLTRIAGDFHLAPLLKFGQEMATTFHSDVNFRNSDIGGELRADKAQFLGHISNFEAVRVGRSFHASGALFGGTVNFREMQVRDNFYIDPFGRMKSFKTLFKGAANFSDVEVHGVFNADQAIFRSESTIFSGMKVGQGAFFIGTIFFGGLVLKEGQLTDLVIRGLHRLSKGGLPLEEIVLNRATIAHRLTIEDVEFKRFDARNLMVKGPVELSRLFIRDEADLRDAACHHLQVVEIGWPAPPEHKPGPKKVFLDGLTYQNITTRSEPDKAEKWKELLAWLGLSRFNAQNFQELDSFFQRGGLKGWADKVHIAGKRRELRKRKWWDPANWLTRFFWGLLAGYGRKPGRTLWIGLGLIILGAFILNPAQVLAPEFLSSLAGYYDNAAHLIALRMIVSAYNFLSAIPGWGGHLSLASPEFHLFVFLWFQRICGWILIPIGLASVYTRLK